ncbi:MAG: AAA family ATPase [Oscillospiraceae bacterium]|nr:AAA family ATPase [Oscillospiraceae bacterium]
MSKKYPSLITKIKVNRATFHDEPIEKLSFINFFYGNNGAGKSSIAYAISENNGDNDSVEWADGRTPSDYDVLVYNRDFVEDNFSNYGDLPGVFIFNKINKDVQSQIDKKSKEKDY